jgi:hypothetical protein
MPCCLALAVVVYTAAAADGTAPAVQAQVEWLEKAMLGILSPAWLDLSTLEPADRDAMWKCGCEQNATGHFDPQHITYGSALGSQCVRSEREGAEWHDGCGKQCVNHAGRAVISFCPPGTAIDCEGGCSFAAATLAAGATAARGDPLDSRLDRLEGAALALLKLDEASVEGRWTAEDFQRHRGCGCAPPLPTAESEATAAGAPLAPVAFFDLTYGTGVGVGCWRLPRDSVPPPAWSEECGVLCGEAAHAEEEGSGGGGGGQEEGGSAAAAAAAAAPTIVREHVSFCPDGMSGSCDGACSFGAPRVGAPVRAAALVKAVHWLAAHPSLAPARAPSQQRLHACGCDAGDGRRVLRVVPYGTKIGLTCTRAPPSADPGYAEECPPVCTGANHSEVMHFCPAGYAPTCAGCVRDGKDEL